MATRDRLSGLDTLLSLFDNLPAATEQELRDDLPKLGATVLAAQRATVPVFSGQLQRGLAVAVLNRGLTVRVGLVDLNAGLRDLRGRPRKGLYGDLYYGRFVEFGRRAQVVYVERRRRVNGALRTRRRRKRAEDIVARYTMKVPAEAPRPFVETPAAIEATLDAAENLADFWSGVIDKAGGAGG